MRVLAATVCLVVHACMGSLAPTASGTGSSGSLDVHVDTPDAGVPPGGTPPRGRSRPGCRCVPPDACWAAVPWRELNSSVAGRLQKSHDELAACLPSEGGRLGSAACATALGSTDDEFWRSASVAQTTMY